MKKIPTLYRRLPDGSIDWEDQVVDIDDAVPTIKWDGTCVLIRDGKILARRMVKPHSAPPPGFEEVDVDEVTGKRFGWVPIDDDPKWRWHHEATYPVATTDWTYELVGPKVQGNPLNLEEHRLIPHGQDILPVDLSPWELVGLCEVMGWEGVVWWNEEAPVAKLKVSDLEWD